MCVQRSKCRHAKFPKVAPVFSFQIGNFGFSVRGFLGFTIGWSIQTLLHTLSVSERYYRTRHFQCCRDRRNRFCKRFTNRFWAGCGGIHEFTYFLYNGFILDIGDLVFSPGLLSVLKPPVYSLLL